MSITTSPNDLLRQRALKGQRLLNLTLSGMFIYCLVLAPWYDSWSTALLWGLPLLGIGIGLPALVPASRAAALTQGLVAMALVALQIHLAQGMIEMHFGVFVVLAFLVVFRDWLVLLAAATFIAVHHLLFCYLQHHGYGVWLFSDMSDHWLRVFIHAGYVVVETAFLIAVAVSADREARDSASLRSAFNQMLADGQHLDLRLTTSGGGEAMDRFRAMTALLTNLVAEARRIADELGQSAKALLDGETTLSRESDLTRRETDSLASAIEQMSAAARTIADHAAQAAQLAVTAGHEERQVRDANSRNLTINTQLASQLGEASTRVHEVNHACQAIDKVVAVITAVAEQTNLLALNAAIEAARAGEMGRGFAVVADEVRSLAARTQQSTTEITQLIRDLQSGSEQTVALMAHCQQISGQSLDASKAVATAVDTLGTALQQIQSLSSEIATATDEQRNVSHSMAASANQIRQRNDGVAALLGQFDQLTSQLQHQQQALQQQMSLLRVNH